MRWTEDPNAGPGMRGTITGTPARPIVVGDATMAVGWRRVAKLYGYTPRKCAPLVCELIRMLSRWAFVPGGL